VDDTVLDMRDDGEILAGSYHCPPMHPPPPADSFPVGVRCVVSYVFVMIRVLADYRGTMIRHEGWKVIVCMRLCPGKFLRGTSHLSLFLDGVPKLQTAASPPSPSEVACEIGNMLCVVKLCVNAPVLTRGRSGSLLVKTRFLCFCGVVQYLKCKKANGTKWQYRLERLVFRSELVCFVLFGFAWRKHTVIIDAQSRYAGTGSQSRSSYLRSRVT